MTLFFGVTLPALAREGDGIIVLSLVRKLVLEKPRRLNLEKNERRPARSTQKGTLKMPLKLRGWTRALGEDGLKMLHRLEQRIGVRAGRRFLFAAKPTPQRVQMASQSLLQPIHGFQGKRQPQRFGGGFQGQARQHLDQPLPHQWRGQGVTR